MTRRTATILSAPLWRWQAALAIVVFAIYAPTLWAGFSVWDDRTHLHENPWLWPPQQRDMLHFWAHPYWGMYVPVAYSFWSMLSVISERLSPTDNPQLFPALFHGANVTVHVGTTLLAFALLRRLNATTLAAFLGALLFAVHPLQVEPVAWVSEARGLLAAFFALAAMVAYPGIDDRPWSTSRYAASSFLFLLALLSKSSAAVTPLLIAVFALTRQGVSFRRATLPLVPWVAAAAVIIVLTKGEQPATASFDPAPVVERPLVGADALVFYLRKLFVPWPLLFDYGRTPRYVMDHCVPWLSLGTVILVTMAALLPRIRTLALPTWGLFIAGLLPILGFVPFSFQATSTVADRYVYLAMLGPAWCAAMIVSRAAKPPSRRVLITVGGIIMLLASVSFWQIGYWHDDVSLFTHELVYRPESTVARYNLGYHYALAGDRQEAERWYRATLEIAPQDRDALLGLGNLAIDSGEIVSAQTWFRQAVDKYPQDADIRNALGVSLAMAGSFGAAEQEFQQAVHLVPVPQPEFLVNLGRALAAQGKRSEAEHALRRALEAAPNFEAALQELAALLESPQQ